MSSRRSSLLCTSIAVFDLIAMVLLSLLKIPFSLHSLMSRLSTDRLLMDVVHGHLLTAEDSCVPTSRRLTACSGSP